jgi:hypothetical protein
MRTPFFGGHGRRMSRTTPSLKAIAALLWAAGLAGGVHPQAHAQAQAQAQSYTYRELPKPSGAIGCEVSRAYTTATPQRNAQGDVTGTCRFVGGYAFITPLTFGPWYLNKPVVWRAGGAAKVLSLPSRTTAVTTAVLDNGDVVGQVLPYASGGLVPLGPMSDHYQTVVWRGTTRSTWTPGWSGGKVDYLGAITLSGTQGLYAEGQTQLVVGQPGAMRVLPPPPTSFPSNVLSYPLLVNDRGQAAVSLLQNVEGSLRRESWFWDGNRWTAITQPDGSAVSSIEDMNNAGQIACTTSKRERMVWTTTGTVTYGGPRVGGPTATITDSGVVLGAIPTPDTSNRNIYADLHAAVWESGPNGQVIDLNARVTLPPKWVLTRAVGMDVQGRILVEAQDTSTTQSYNGRKVLLLTPR